MLLHGTNRDHTAHDAKEPAGKTRAKKQRGPVKNLSHHHPQMSLGFTCFGWCISSSGKILSSISGVKNQPNKTPIATPVKNNVI